MPRVRVTGRMSRAMIDSPQLIRPRFRVVQEAADEAAIEWRGQRKRMFATEGRSTDAFWPALSPRYAKRKLKLRAALGRAGLGKILQLSGGLRESWIKKNDPNNVVFAFRRQEGVYQIQLGTDHPLARYHEEGSSRGLPVRRQSHVTRQQQRKLFQRMSDVLVPEIERAIKTAATQFENLKLAQQGKL